MIWRIKICRLHANGLQSRGRFAYMLTCRRDAGVLVISFLCRYIKCDGTLLRKKPEVIRTNSRRYGTVPGREAVMSGPTKPVPIHVPWYV